MQGKSVFRQATLAYEALIKAASSFQSPFLLAVRLYWGWQFAQTGWGKLQHLPRVTNFFATLGIPAPALSAVAISSLELIGGIGLALGLGSRFWGLLLTGDMFVAYLTRVGKISWRSSLIRASFMVTMHTRFSLHRY